MGTNHARKRRPVLVVVEGTNDIDFLKRISRVLRCEDPTVLGKSKNRSCSCPPEAAIREPG